MGLPPIDDGKGNRKGKAKKSNANERATADPASQDIETSHLNNQKSQVSNQRQTQTQVELPHSQQSMQNQQHISAIGTIESFQPPPPSEALRQGDWDQPLSSRRPALAEIEVNTLRSSTRKRKRSSRM